MLKFMVYLLLLEKFVLLLFLNFLKSFLILKLFQGQVFSFNFSLHLIKYSLFLQLILNYFLFIYFSGQRWCGIIDYDITRNPVTADECFSFFHNEIYFLFPPAFIVLVFNFQWLSIIHRIFINLLHIIDIPED